MQTNSSKQWYYARNGERFGPVTMDQLQELAHSQQLAPSDLLWSDGMTEWKPAGHSRRLFPNSETDRMPPLPSLSKDDEDGDYDYAGFWLRVGATFLDGILFWIIQIVVGGTAFLYLIFIFANVEIPKDIDPKKAQEAMEVAGMIMVVLTWLIVQFIMIMIQWLYYAVMECSAAQGSLGKMAVGIKVTDLEGERISFGRASGRFFGKLVSGLIFGIGLLMVGFTARKQGLHDIMAGCLVVRK